jgi:hypothetical protein
MGLCLFMAMRGVNEGEQGCLTKTKIVIKMVRLIEDFFGKKLQV